MGVSDRLFGFFKWIANAIISLIISVIILIGTLTAAYFNFNAGMAVFWAGCLLTAIHRGHGIYRMKYGVRNAARVYMSAALSMILNVVFGYGGAYLIYAYGTSARTASPLMEAIFPQRAPYVFALTAVIYTSLQILLNVARALMAFKFSRSS